MSGADSKQTDDVWKAAADAADHGGEGFVVTIIGVRGSIPGQLGAKALIGASGIQVGNLGGGKVFRVRTQRIKFRATKVSDVRPNRSELRAVKQRPKGYQRLTAPRHVLRVSDTGSNRHQQQNRSA